jgi:protein-L-isoaspartate(D-aspartate) O-methyltransferase
VTQMPWPVKMLYNELMGRSVQARRLLLGIALVLLAVVLILALVRAFGAGTEVALQTPAPADKSTPALAIVPSPTDAFLDLRLAMVGQQIEGRGVTDPAVLEVMRRVPRQLFVPADEISMAYGDYPLPIGYGQTISQPYIVALMTESLEVKTGDRVLEIGTGSGYQAAILAELGAEVYTMEIIPELAQQAAERLRSLGYDKMQVRNADGYFGWQEHAPYDAIIVTAAPDHLPQELLSQLRDGGRLVIPIGPQGAIQTLWLFQKSEGEVSARNLGQVMFVPLTGSGH